jgi:metal-dependent amidase/aminoacylase/carboxypeptidase family protein
LSICTLEAGHGSNVIPDEVKLSGTTRALTPEIADGLESKIRRVLAGVCAATETSYEMDYHALYQVSMNDPQAVEEVRCAAKKAGLQYVDLPKPDMAAEDFSYYLAKCPGAMIFLGLGEDYTKLHRNTFDFDDDVLANGVAYLVHLVTGA